MRYAKGKTAEWMLNLLESGASVDEPLLECAEWVLGDFSNVLRRLEGVLENMSRESGISKICKKLRELLEYKRGHSVHDEINDLAETYASLDKPLTEMIFSECAAAAKIAKEGGAAYRRARQSLRSAFGIGKEACMICEFLFIKDAFGPVESYFENELEIFKFSSRKRFADMFRMKPTELQACVCELVSCGICEKRNDCYYLADGVDSFWDSVSSAKAKNLFCRPLQGKTLSLENFDISPDDITHVRALLERDGDFPVHILLYGESGTGKTTFARSLARELNLKAWLVPCDEENNKGDNRLAKLSACLNMASKHKNAFVLMDEADRFLDTGAHCGWKTKDKAWINEFLEQPGRRVIWIANDIGHIHPSVRRRFSYSVCFKPLNRDERRRVWNGILKEQRAAKFLHEEQVKRLASDYRVSPAVVENAVRQAKILSCGKADFADTTERVLRAYVTLSNDGAQTRLKPSLPGEYALEGVCLEGSADEFLKKCRRIDALMRQDKPIRPGGAAMLFYGPPGSGKSALAKHLADELGRELVTKRASDLLSPYVGTSERLIAETFRDAARAVLVIDEADSFLYARERSARSWENTLVNEFLTSLEDCLGFCVCTTNRMEDMDAAALRRFSFKLSFGYAGPEQTMALYKTPLAPLVEGKLPKHIEEKLSCMRHLTPGDFHAVKSQYWLAERGETTHEQLLEALASEERLKLDRQARRVGF
jgi:SpoVK/Ycf46/Vps4 family AAA+-type ATPase